MPPPKRNTNEAVLLATPLSMNRNIKRTFPPFTPAQWVALPALANQIPNYLLVAYATCKPKPATSQFPQKRRALRATWSPLRGEGEEPDGERFMAPIRVRSWRSKLPMELRNIMKRGHLSPALSPGRGEVVQRTDDGGRLSLEHINFYCSHPLTIPLPQWWRWCQIPPD